MAPTLLFWQFLYVCPGSAQRKHDPGGLLSLGQLLAICPYDEQLKHLTWSPGTEVLFAEVVDIVGREVFMKLLEASLHISFRIFSE